MGIKRLYVIKIGFCMCGFLFMEPLSEEDFFPIQLLKLTAPMTYQGNSCFVVMGFDTDSMWVELVLFYLYEYNY